MSLEEAIVVVGQCHRRRFWKEKEKREASHHRGIIKTRHDWSERKRTLRVENSLHGGRERERERERGKKKGVVVVFVVVVVVIT